MSVDPVTQHLGDLDIGSHATLEPSSEMDVDTSTAAGGVSCSNHSADPIQVLGTLTGVLKPTTGAYKSNDIKNILGFELIHRRYDGADRRKLKGSTKKIPSSPRLACVTIAMEMTSIITTINGHTMEKSIFQPQKNAFIRETFHSPFNLIWVSN